MTKKENNLTPNRFQAELLAAREAKRLLDRDQPKYLRRIIGLYGSGFLHFLSEKEFSNVGTLTRETYLFFRHIDDALDGDIEIEGSPIAYVRRIQSDIKHDREEISDLAKMARYSLSVLEPVAKEDEDPEQHFIDAIDAMIYDYRRRQSREVLTGEQIDQYYFNTFAPVLNLMFIGIKSDLRVTQEQLRNLAICQGRVYSLRDLESDWENGIINIPKEVLDKTGLSTEDSIEEIKMHKEVRNWIALEIFQQKERVEAVRTEIENSGESFTLKALDFALITHMLKAIDKLEVKYY